MFKTLDGKRLRHFLKNSESLDCTYSYLNWKVPKDKLEKGVPDRTGDMNFGSEKKKGTKANYHKKWQANQPKYKKVVVQKVEEESKLS